MTLTFRGSSCEIGSELPLVQPIVELQYRGKSYQARTSAAPAQVHATLTFRGASYAKWFTVMTSPYYDGAAFVRCRKAAKTEATVQRLEASLAAPPVARPLFVYRGASHAR